MADPNNVPIAIIGMACRFAGGVDTPSKLWDICTEGRSAWSEIPASRFNLQGIYHPSGAKVNTSNVIGGHFLEEDVALFDAGFFNFPAELASSFDPQFRLQLENTYEALESAGLSLQSVAGSNTSVFAGSFFKDYNDAHLRDPETLPRSLLMGVGAAMASNRLSHFFDLRGASISIDTGCSTTLTALHQACQNLRAGESDMSIIGGANVMLNPDNFIIMSSLTLLSPAGRSYAFDSRASGYGRGEGSATVIIKRLDDALRDGDPIRAIIRGSACNQDGKTETITTPSQEAQEELIRLCYSRAGLNLSDTTYFEAHGTGTPTGDPIEARAIASVFREKRSPEHPLLIGSVKTNVGHCETASGLASIIKVTMALEKGVIPPSINFEEENKNIHLTQWNLKLPREVEVWPEVNGIRRASVNNFGYGGTNAHIIMESYESYLAGQKQNATKLISIPEKDTEIANSEISSDEGIVLGTLKNDIAGYYTPSDSNDSDEEGHNKTDISLKLAQSQAVEKHATDLIVVDEATAKENQDKLKSRVIRITGKDEQAAVATATKLKDYLQSTTIQDETRLLDDLAYTLGQRRSVLPWASAASVDSIPSLIKALEFGKFKPSRTNETPKIGFVFTGQGAQWWAMGRELIESYPVFKQTVVEAEGYLSEFGCEWSLIDELTKSAETTRVNELAMSTPLTAVVQIGVVRLLRSWGIIPSAVTSHSSGEIAAAYTAGALTLRAAMAIGFARGQCAGSQDPSLNRKGGMVAVGLGADDVQKYIDRVTSGQVVVACLNSPSSSTVSGDVSGVEELQKYLQEEDIFVRRLKIDAAYHSHHMKFIEAPYLAWLENLITEEGTLDENIIYSSPTTGKRETSGKLISSPQHWVTSLTHPVQFVDSFRNMCFEDASSTVSSVDVVIEVGPHAALGGPIQEIISRPEFKGCKVKYFPSLIRKSSAVDTMQALVSDLIRSGFPVNMESINFPFGKRGVSVLCDLPRYPWNHTIRHWSEPRINKSHRFRKHAPHDLLGHHVLGTNMLTPSWRHLVRIAELPWLRDHVVQSQILYPGAGYLCMAIEAAHQTAKASDNIVLGYELRDIDFLQALVVPDTVEGIEVQITFRQASEKAIYAKGWKEFVVYSVTTDNQWIEHCKGLVKTNVITQVGNDDSAAVAEEQAQWSPPASAKNQLSGHSEASEYRKYIHPRDVYQSMSSVTICHGPIFQNLASTKARGNQSVTTFTIADTAATMPYQHQHPHVIDPTTLDSLFQAGYAGYIATPGIPKLATPLVPRSIKKLYLAHNIVSKAGAELKAFLDMNKATTQGFDTDIVVVDDAISSSIPVLKMENFVTQSLGNVLAQTDDSYENEKLATVKWAPDVSLASSDYIKKQLGATITTSESEIIMDLKRLTIHFISGALSDLTDEDVVGAEWYHQKFVTWMRSQLELAQQNKLAHNSSEWINDSAEERAKLVEKTNASSVNGEMVCRLGPKVVSMLRKEVTPLELMLEDKLLYRYYVDALGWNRSSQQVGKLVKMFAHKNPRAKILEIGGGTGGTTQYTLNALGTSSTGGPLAASYDFTDISSGFFEAAQQKFAEWESIVRYKKLDIEQDVVKQGFEAGSYDLIIACQVLHATKNMEHTMTNVRNLLKPGGKLVLFETTQDPTDLFFTFGLLPGWWLSEEDERKYGPSLSIDMWNRTLKATGFTGVDTETHDCDSDALYSFSVMTSTAKSSTPRAYDSDVVIVTGSTVPPRHWIDHLTGSIANVIGAAPTVANLETVDATGKICIFIGDLEGSILKEPTREQFENIRCLVTKSKGLLWATIGGAVNCENPHASLSQGFLRTLRVEYAGKRLINLDLDPKKEAMSTRSVQAITSVFRNIFNYGKDNIVMDFEFADRDDVVQVPRYFQDSQRNQVVFPNLSKLAEGELKAFNQPGRSLRLTVGNPGLLDTLAWKDDPDADKDLREDMIEVEPKAFGLNFRDIMVAMGQLDADYMGFECSGIVKRVGPVAAAQGFNVGDRIATLMRGHYGSLVRVEWTSAIHIPDDMTFETAATLPMSFSTAYFALFELGRVKKGESVLIHAASGGLGQAAIVLAKHVGAEIFVTIGTEKKREFIINEYNIAPDHIFSSRDDSFAAGIMAMTKNRGVDIVLNTLAGTLLQESFNCVARFGRFVEIGKRDLEQNSLLEMGAFARSITISSFDLLLYGEFRGLEVNRVMKDIINLFKQGVIEPVKPVTVYPLSELERAYRLMQAGKHIGKIIISVSGDDLVPILPQRSVAKFQADASYLIVGGVGGIGRSVCEWMISRGAKNLIVLSRGASPEKIRPFTTEMAKLGCKVKGVGCDISKALDLAIALNSCARDMPPIRGVIQGAMVLQDSIIEQMTLEQYNAAVRPKVHGSWNLHNQLTNLDFFILLSSLSGIGGFASQSNYSAGNTFEDALARHRVGKGLHGASIDIGVVKSVGYVAENRGTAERLKKSGYKELTEDDVLQAIESSIVSSPQTQMLLGLNGADWEESGLARDQRFTGLTARTLGSGSTSVSKSASGEVGGLIAAAATLEEAAAVVLDSLTKKLMDIFMITEAEVDPSKSLSGFGVDSLVAVELRNMLALRCGAEVSIFDIMQSASIAALSVTVASRSSHIDPCLVPS